MGGETGEKSGTKTEKNKFESLNWDKSEYIPGISQIYNVFIRFNGVILPETDKSWRNFNSGLSKFIKKKNKKNKKNKKKHFAKEKNPEGKKWDGEKNPFTS
jgi:hypothetical protein